jgi:hypothetical protein
MSQAEIAIEKEKLTAIEKEKNKLKVNFRIPINPNGYVTPGTKPFLKDSLFSKIIFSSNGVLHKQPGKKWGSDDVSTWAMTLTIDRFELNSSNGINKSYKILNIKYNEQLKMQEFELGTYEGNYTHNLDICWSNSLKQYTVLLTSIDYSEQYQFQNTQATSKK